MCESGEKQFLYNVFSKILSAFTLFSYFRPQNNKTAISNENLQDRSLSKYVADDSCT